MRILVTGGAGYIGSHTVWALTRSGHRVHVVDDLSSGHMRAIPEGVELEQADILVPGALEEAVRKSAADAIIHFAGRIAVGESVRRPGLYYEANVGGMLRVLAAARAGRLPVLFSSTASVYGEPETVPISVEHPCRPANPYSRSKWWCEQMLADCAQTADFPYGVLRYFNAAGADVAAGLGEWHDPETHLIPLAIEAVRSGVPLALFGNDWPTADGTCIRDYVHVVDLAQAHVLALDRLAMGRSLVLNLGSGQGASVREVLAAVGKRMGSVVPFVVRSRRPGDVAVLVAEIDCARELLGWQPRRSQIETIVADAVAATASSGSG